MALIGDGFLRYCCCFGLLTIKVLFHACIFTGLFFLLQLVKDDIQKKEKREPVDVLQIRPVTPIEEYIKVEPSPHPFPKTTSQTVGWRSTSKVHALEKYGKYAKPKGGLIRQLNWPAEAID